MPEIKSHVALTDETDRSRQSFLTVNPSTASRAMAVVTVPLILTGPSRVARVTLTEVILVWTAWLGVIVLDVGSKIQELVVDVDIPQAAVKVNVLDRELVWKLRKASDDEWTVEVQEPEFPKELSLGSAGEVIKLMAIIKSYRWITIIKDYPSSLKIVVNGNGMPLPIIDSSLPGCGYHGDNTTGGERESNLAVDDLQSDEVILLGVAAIVEDQSVGLQGGKADRQLEPHSLTQRIEHHERLWWETPRPTLAKRTVKLVGIRTATIKASVEEVAAGSSMFADAVCCPRATPLANVDLTVGSNETLLAHASIASFLLDTSSLIQTGVGVAEVDLRHAVVPCEPWWAITLVVGHRMDRPENDRCRRDEATGRPEDKRRDALVEVAADLVEAQVIAKGKNSSTQRLGQLAALQVDSLLEVLRAEEGAVGTLRRERDVEDHGLLILDAEEVDQFLVGGDDPS